MLRQEMPNKREDLALVDSYIAFDGGLVRCAHCHKTFRTANRLTVARRHVRKHVSDGLIFTPEDEAGIQTDSETDGELRNI